jgi:tagatose 1,6-diphosphate aldolase
MTTPGKVRGLSQAANDAGVFTIFAIDHRDAMRVVLDPDDPSAVSADTLTSTKLAFVEALCGDASAVLLDPEYSAIEAVTRRSLGGRTALLCSLEAQGYLGDANGRTTTVLDDWSVEKAKRLGASGVKLLLPYRPDSPAADAQDALVAVVVADCARWDIPLFLEPVSYSLSDDDGGTPSRRWLVCESVRRLAPLGPDVLKLQFPSDTGSPDLASWSDACSELDEASSVPWTLLSGGDPFHSFLQQVTVACSQGASGFLVGRSLWALAARVPEPERARQISTLVLPRFRDLASVATELATPWFERNPYRSIAEPGFAAY